MSIFSVATLLALYFLVQHPPNLRTPIENTDTTTKQVSHRANLRRGAHAVLSGPSSPATAEICTSVYLLTLTRSGPGGPALVYLSRKVRRRQSTCQESPPLGHRKYTDPVLSHVMLHLPALTVWSECGPMYILPCWFLDVIPIPPLPMIDDTDRKRSSKACERCRHRRSRCVGGFPCDACQRVGLRAECVVRDKARPGR